MISSYVKKQLIVLTFLSVSAALIIIFVYAHIPTVLGFGQQNLTAYFTDGAGVYKDSNVTVRGAVIGKVHKISLSPQGVRVDMSIDETKKVGADARAAIHGVSAVGEIYVDLVSNQAAGPYLEDGAVIPIERTEVPEQIAPVLDKVTTFIHSFPNDGIQTFLDEGSKAFDNLGPDLRTLIDSAQNLTASADQHFQQTQTLINTIGPLLDTQVVNGYGDNIKKYFAELAHFTGVFASEDGHFRGALKTVQPAATRAEDFLSDNENTAPVLARNGRTMGHLFGVYRGGLEQILVQYPIVVAREQRATAADRGIQVTLNAAMYPHCEEGFKANDLRNPNDMTDKDGPVNAYCKAPHDSTKVVRGARNIPCAEGFVGMRAATIDECFGRRPDQTGGTTGIPDYKRPTFSGPAFAQNGPFTRADNQRNYQHDVPVSGGEPLAPLGAKSTAAPVKEESWQSLLSAPLSN
jgi:phospholipid/cholesterol/gamma-HCH transport system substrate-binding protein